MPADEIVAARERNLRTKRSTSWWPYLVSSVFHAGLFAAFLQFGGPGAGGATGPHAGESIRLVGRFLEGEEGNGGDGDGSVGINIAASLEGPNQNLEEPPEQEEPAPVEQEEEPEPVPQPPPAVRPRLRPVQNVAHITEAELEPPPEVESVEETLVEEPAPRARRVSANSDPVTQASEASRRGGAGPRGVGRGMGREGSGDGVGFFGLQARARTVVYVIDASSSMEPHSAMAQAIAELEASLDALPATAKYGIVFFNNVPSMLPASGASQALANTPRNRRIAQQFISSVIPDAGSDRLSGLMAALSFKPDAVFLLTDAGEPPLAAADIEAFRRRNRGRAPVHVIEFGVGSQLVRENFLTRLARQTAGGYQYVDVTGEQ